MKNSSEDKIGFLDLRRMNLLRKLGLKITPAMREYCRYTGISAEVEKHGFGHSDNSGLQPPEKPEHHPHGH